MNFKLYISELQALRSYINKNNELGCKGALGNIAKRYISFTESLPYSWYFAEHLLYSDLDDFIKGNEMEFEALLHNLDVIEGRIDFYKKSNLKTEYIFAKFDKLKENIIKEIRKTKNKIDIAVAWITDKDICNELSKASERGVSIKILMIDCEDNRGILKYLDKKIETRLAKSESSYRGNFMHNKFCIFDMETILTGSYNWSFSAKFHDENVLIVLKEELAKEFDKEFSKLWSKYK